MEIIKSNNGFPYAWKAGRVEQLIRNILERKAREQLNVDRVMIVNPTWLHETNLAQDIRDAHPDFIICHNFVDPAVPKIFEAIETSGVPYIILGNSAQYRIDFWAMVCDLYFQNYEERDLQLDPNARKFICLNRKPHPHRVALVEHLISAGLQEQGYISLGRPGNPIVLDEAFDDSQGIKDEYGNLGVDETFVTRHIRNDIFSVGSLDIWRKSLLCLVTETEFSNANPNNFFTSEKTFKPIIGMRPFFIYGQAPLRKHLKDSGFDIFEDIFDYQSIIEDRGSPYKQFQYARAAVNAINQITDTSSDWRRYFGRCQANKNHFRTYAYEQWERLNTLDLTRYV